MKNNENLFNVVKSYYKVLDDLAMRLQEDYNGDKPFVQKEEDRLALCFILDFFDDLENELKSKKMSFKEQLDKATENGLNICDLTIANECECVFDFDYTEEEFEQLCARAREIYLKGDNLTENSVAKAINELIKDEEKTIKQVLAIDKWKLIDKASYYI